MRHTDLRGKTVVVTGASRGLGRALVDLLVGEGVQVACLARPSDALAELARVHGEMVLPVACDMGDLGQIDSAIETVVGKFGRIDALVNNAAIFQPFLLEEARAEQIEQHFRINVIGPAWLMRAAIPHLRAARGQIISVSSESVRMPFPFLTIYAATKGALEVLSAGLREELRDQGIRVSVLRAGSMTGGSGDRDWAPDVAHRFFERIQQTGHAHFTGEAAAQESVASVVLDLLTLPPDVNIDLIEARGAAALSIHPN